MISLKLTKITLIGFSMLALLSAIAAFNLWQLWGVKVDGVLTDPHNMYGKFLSLSFLFWSSFGLVVGLVVKSATKWVGLLMLMEVWWFFSMNYVLDNFLFDPNRVEVNEYVTCAFIILAVIFTHRLTR